MSIQNRAHRFWATWPVSLRAIVAGVLIALPAANVWPLLLVGLGAPLASAVEIVFLGLYVWWASGGGPPRRTKAARAGAVRGGALSPAQWAWGVVGALFFAATVHAAIVLLFRLVPFPLAEFRRGYDLSFTPTPALKWLAVAISATSAGVCEEIGFRGYMQRPIERRHGAPIAILVSSLLFMALHLSKSWATAGMVPIVFGAGILLGLLAWSSASLIPCVVGHIVMNVGLFAYWWTGIAGDFTARPISETGVDRPFEMASTAFAVALLVVLVSTWRLRQLRSA